MDCTGRGSAETEGLVLRLDATVAFFGFGTLIVSITAVSSVLIISSPGVGSIPQIPFVCSIIAYHKYHLREQSGIYRMLQLA